MSREIYCDTSALAKWYINENGSDEVERYLQQHGPATIRGWRRRYLPPFRKTFRRRFLICLPLPTELAAGAVNLMAILGEIPLRSLDAMHLIIAKETGTEVLITDDRIMSDAAQALDFEVVRF